ncbi:MAG TPA: XdhC family protein [Edaphobacter sp.]|nr:XdhC family protein [Edaphobacter sp.]
MREQRQIVERWHQGSASVLVTLIRVQGSSYRQPGARLIVCKDGTYEGSISGGCLEADLLRKATWLTRDGAAVERYSTLFDETTDVPFGLGCGGVLDILLESVETAECQALLLAVEATLSGHEHLVATWLPKDDEGLMRAVFRADGELIFASKGLTSKRISEGRIKCVHDAETPLNGMAVERLMPPQRLFVFGAGNDAKPLVTMACLLGWSVKVIDWRAHLARKNRFPQQNAEVISTPDAAIQQIDSRAAVVIMTHSYEQDRDYLVSLLPAKPKYLGLLGSRQRSSLLIAEAAAKLEWSVSECCQYICAPIGLNIGGEGPEAIALSIIAEAQAYCMARPSEPRGLSADHVQRYLATGDAQHYLQNQCSLDTI